MYAIKRSGILHIYKKPFAFYTLKEVLFLLKNILLHRYFYIASIKVLLPPPYAVTMNQDSLFSVTCDFVDEPRSTFSTVKVLNTLSSTLEVAEKDRLRRISKRFNIWYSLDRAFQHFAWISEMR